MDKHSSPSSCTTISYHPDFKQYQNRVNWRLQNENIQPGMPKEYPKILSSGLAWKPDDFLDSGEASWTHNLSEAQLAEIDLALKHFKGNHRQISPPALTFRQDWLSKLQINRDSDSKSHLGQISPRTFPLPTLHPFLRTLSDQIHYTRGFAVLRGLEVDKHTLEENIIIYVGISSHIGCLRGRQDNEHDGEPADVVISHIKDLSGTDKKESIGAPAYTAEKQVFHTDSGDIVSLFSLCEAASGGKSQLASSWTVYNELAKERSDLIRTLADDWIIDGFNKPDRPYTKRPLIFHQPATEKDPERVILQCTRGSFTGYGKLSRSPNIPPITEAQAEALDAVHFLAEKFHIALNLQKGDIQYINDYCTLHAREAYADDDENQRHLLRMWFQDPLNAWQLPSALRTRSDGVYKGVLEEKQAFPLEPVVRSASNATKIQNLAQILTDH